MSESVQKFLFVAVEILNPKKSCEQTWFYFAGGESEMESEFEIYRSRGDTIVIKFKCWMSEVIRWEASS